MHTTTALLANAAPPQLLPARQLMAFTLASHILLVPFGVALPCITLLMHHRGLRRGDDVALKLARRWSAVMAVQFAIGVVTGTVLTFEFGLLWPGMMGRWGDVFGLGFGVEAWAFFLEAVLIAIYLYGWRRLKPWTHFWLGLPLPLAALLGAFGIIAANSWMNTPQGFTLDAAGRPVDVDVRQAIFTPMFGPEYWHFAVAMFLTAGYVVAGVYAVGLLRGRRDRYHRLGFALPFTGAAILTPVQFVLGDSIARSADPAQPRNVEEDAPADDAVARHADRQIGCLAWLCGHEPGSSRRAGRAAARSSGLPAACRDGRVSGPPPGRAPRRAWWRP